MDLSSLITITIVLSMLKITGRLFQKLAPGEKLPDCTCVAVPFSDVVYAMVLFLAALGDPPEPFLLYSNAKLGHIRGISLDPTDVQNVMQPIMGLSRPVALSFDWVTQRVFYSDVHRFRIGWRAVNGSAGDPDFLSGSKFLSGFTTLA